MPVVLKNYFEAIIGAKSIKSQSTPSALLIFSRCLWQKPKQYARDKHMSNTEKKQDSRTAKGLTAISKTILPFARQILGTKGFVEVDILTNWTHIVGDELAEFCLPLKIDFQRGQKNNGILHLSVLSGAFALEIQHRERFIIEKINTYFGYYAVAKIKIIQNNDISFDKLNKINTISDNEKPKAIVSAEEENYIKDLTEEVSNSKLKEILVKLGKSVFNNNKSENKIK